ncbi:C1 family peptidase [Rubritalea squalenifaciens]|uniref:C1 family peptidase n=1 Tax=Rubritalea squalenifaciens TaxID=407226 RepID=UPI00135641E6|nr:C1 family peptidase [Rubritalea squalenifaciens]
MDLEEDAQQPQLSRIAKRSLEDLPSRVDLRPYCPVPGDQGNHGTCTAWSSAYHGRTILEAISADRRSKSENTKEAFSPSFVYNQIRSTGGCDQGTSVPSALSLMKRKGALKAQVLKFNCSFTAWDKYRDITEPYKIYGYLKLHEPFSNNKVLPVKKALAEKQPVLCSMHLEKSFHQPKNGRYVPSSSERQVVIDFNFMRDGKYKGHAMCVVGYDDKVGRNGAFLLINSWGTSWGNGGYCWVEYEDYARFVVQSYSMVNPPSYDDNLSGAIVMETEKGQRMTVKHNPAKQAYTLDENWLAGTRFRLYLENQSPVHLYAFGFDESGQASAVFPYAPRVSSLIPYKKNYVPIPDEEHFIEIEDTPGRNELCVLYSNKEVDLDKLIKAINVRGKAIVQKDLSIDVVIREELNKLGITPVPTNQIQYINNEVRFTSKRLKEQCVPLVIRFR